MSVIKDIGTKTLNVAGQSATVSATIEQDDTNGQLYLRVAGTLGAETVTRKHSIGAEDGKDALAGMVSDAVAAAIQSDLDNLRQRVARALATRANVKTAAAQLT